MATRNISSFLETLEDLVEQYDDDWEYCSNVLLSLGCYLTFPPCDPVKGNALPICTMDPENCNTTNHYLQPCIDRMVSDSDLAELVKSFNSCNSSSYLPTSVSIDSQQCISGSNFSLLTDEEENEETGRSKTGT